MHRPKITTDRLILRAHTIDDLDAVFELATDPAVLQFIRGLPTSREEAWHRLLRYAGHWSLLGFGMFAVFERASGAFMSDVPALLPNGQNVRFPLFHPPRARIPAAGLWGNVTRLALLCSPANRR
ncbi:hypothetical protein GCM10017612_17750 [Novosphingobium resinovorum]|nr:hypothetical protein GCM10017612_17750 [Novosphingobium resinovorum]